MGVKRDNETLSNVTPAIEQENMAEMDMKVKKYLRGDGANLEALQDKKLKGQLAVREELYGRSAKAAAKAEKWLMPSEGGYLEAEGIEKTWRIKQESIAREVDILSSRNQYDIVLPELGPYTLDFTSSGRYMAVAGRKGHLAIIDMKNMGLMKELQVPVHFVDMFSKCLGLPSLHQHVKQHWIPPKFCSCCLVVELVRETVRDVVFLHNELFFAAAQKNVRIFDLIASRFPFLLAVVQEKHYEGVNGK
ncbi:unnamed protein product [Ilex paraguariensis]|uniref:Uncharacterized protein n=1 Tax=Ilex paraguariensis TaxID=185542 RepID=A0ABC8SWQ9_9AQUA